MLYTIVIFWYYTIYFFNFVLVTYIHEELLIWYTLRSLAPVMIKSSKTSEVVRHQEYSGTHSGTPLNGHLQYNIQFGLYLPIQTYPYSGHLGEKFALACKTNSKKS